MRARAGTKPDAKRTATVSHPHDAAERQADRAAQTVAGGGSVTGWSFASVAPSVHRQETGAPASNEEKLKQAAAKAGEAALQTEAGKKLQAAVQEDPLVKRATAFLDTTAGKVAAGGVIAAGVGTLAATKQPLPFQAPDIPLDRITPGLSAQVRVEGPLNAPSFVGLSLTYQERAPAYPKGPSAKEGYAAETARMKAGLDMFKPQSVKQQEAADERAAVAAYLAAQSKRFRSATLIPLTPGAAPKTIEVPGPEPAQRDQEETAPVQRSPATTAEPAPDTSGVDQGLDDSGRALDPATRRSMEARFGYDFGSVRIHDNGSAAAAAAGLQASAFTVGEDIAFAVGRFDPATPQGRHLLAHELAHVVQQRGSNAAGARHLQRRSIFESAGILLGLVEGTFSDTELRAYLERITAQDAIDGTYDADNKARAIVRLWKAGTAGWDLLGRQKALLIDEMLDGPTLNADERAILDLLQGSDAADLRTVFADPVARMQRLDRDIDGAEHDQLDAFVAGRFTGGRTALLAGTVAVAGPAVPAQAPRHGFDPDLFDARLDSDRSAEELIALLDAFTPDDRGAALHHLMHQVWPAAKKQRAAAAAADRDGLDQAAIRRLDRQEAVARRRIAKAERILQHAFLAQVPPTKEELIAGTEPMDPALAEQLRNVLLPKQYTAEAAAEQEQEQEQPESTPQQAEPAGPTSAAPEPVPPRAQFHDDDAYRAEVLAALPDIIDGSYDSTVTQQGPRAGNEEVEAMAVPAKNETDAVFGQFYDAGKHPALQYDRKGRPGTLHSWYDTADRELKAMTKSQRRSLAVEWVKYYFQASRTIRDLNDKYSASPQWEPKKNREAKILQSVAEEVCKDPQTVGKLVETRRAWGGMAVGSQVYVDLYHNPDTTKDRLARWEMFQTLVHEYLHTLAHDMYEKYAQSFGADSPQWNTLIEGVDNVLGEVVWARVSPRTTHTDLRTAVEGRAHAGLPPLNVPPPARYASYEEALRLTAMVGIGNVIAAYFLGLVDRISAPVKKKGGTK